MEKLSKWDEQKLQSELNKMPLLKDRQTKEELVTRIKAKQLQQKRLKKHYWYVSSIAVVALILFALGLPAFFPESNQSLENSHFSTEEGAELRIAINSSEQFEEELSIKFSVEGDNVAYVSELADAEDINRGYYIVTNETGEKHLVPGIEVGAPLFNDSDEYLTLKETLEQMKLGDNNSNAYEASIFSNVNIKEVEDDEGDVKITFDRDTRLINSDEYVMLLEAIMFTAKEFGYDYILFDGAKLEQVGPYHITGKIKIPSYGTHND